MKTIKEWLSELPEPYKTQALTAYAIYPFPSSLNQSTDSLQSAVDEGFNWEKTEQGNEYWENLSGVINEGKLFPLFKPITNALSAIHAIALKRGFAAEEIMSIRLLHGLWGYTLKDKEAAEFFINLSTE